MAHELIEGYSLLMGVFENWAEVWGKEDGKRINWVGTSLPSPCMPYQL